MTPLIYKKSKKSDKILIEQKNLSKGLFAMNNISQNIRYYPHDLNTKFYATKLYMSGYPISLVCRKYKISKSSLLRWVKKFDGTKESLIDKSHRPLSKHPNALTDEELKWIKVIQEEIHILLFLNYMENLELKRVTLDMLVLYLEL